MVEAPREASEIAGQSAPEPAAWANAGTTPFSDRAELYEEQKAKHARRSKMSKVGTGSDPRQSHVP
jgi:hypothetical protein